jgi:hypothetical protein
MTPANTASAHAAEHDVVERDPGILTVVELILKQPERLDRLIRGALAPMQLVPRLLAIALVAFAVYGIAQAVVLGAAGVWPRLSRLDATWQSGELTPLVLRPSTTTAVGQHWRDGSAFALIVAYVVGLIAASGVCLPSLYFYGLLAGVRLTMLDVVLHTLKSKAAAAVALIGILPIYAALALAVVIVPLPWAARAPILWLGMILQFLAGLWGTWSLYRGFLQLADTLPDGCRGRRACFLRRLVLAWAACYTAVTPVMIFTLWQRLSPLAG